MRLINNVVRLIHRAVVHGACTKDVPGNGEHLAALHVINPEGFVPGEREQHITLDAEIASHAELASDRATA